MCETKVQPVIANLRIVGNGCKYENKEKVVKAALPPPPYDRPPSPPAAGAAAACRPGSVLGNPTLRWDRVYIVLWGTNNTQMMLNIVTMLYKALFLFAQPQNTN